MTILLPGNRVKLLNGGEGIIRSVTIYAPEYCEYEITDSDNICRNYSTVEFIALEDQTKNGVLLC